MGVRALGAAGTQDCGCEALTENQTNKLTATKEERQEAFFFSGI